MAIAVARACNGLSGSKIPGQGRSPSEGETFLVFGPSMEIAKLPTF